MAAVAAVAAEKVTCGHRDVFAVLVPPCNLYGRG